MSQIHKTAYISPKSKIGKDVKIGFYSYIGDNVEIGDNTEIGNFVVIEKNVILGNNNKIYTGAVIGTDPQDLTYSQEETWVVIGNNNTIREYVTINRGSTKATRKTVVGNNNMLMAYVHIAHDCVLGDNVILANGVTLAGHTEVDDYAAIGGLTPVHQFVKIGKMCFIGGASRVNKDVPPFVRVAGNPARVFDLNTVGMRRYGVNPEARKIIRHAFKLIFRSNYNVSQAIHKIRETLPLIEEIIYMIEFIETSERGIHL